MAEHFGLKIGLEGEKEFKKALADINRSFRVLGSEMKLVESQFGKNDKSLEGSAAKQRVLNKEIEAQKEKITTLKAALENAATSFGENDRRTDNWRIKLNEAEAALNDMEKELDESKDSAKDMGEELEESGKSAEASEGKFKKLGSVLKGMAVAMGTAAVAAGAAAIKLGKDVIQEFGELEQNLGGSEAVFGRYAASIQKTGEDAYKNMGISQSQFLATANKMGALFQGSGIEQQKSLALTEKAMQRAADMASVMGIDMQMALDSVAGAAKGNFTMMDNLGVAMNATNIEAYALAKGLDFTWATATQAEKAEVAMQMFFENTEQYAGNFARESTETVTGSLGLLQASVQSFVGGLGNANADMTNLTANVVDAFGAVVKNIVPVLKNVITAIPIAVGGIMEAMGEILPTLLETATALFTQVLETLLSLLPKLIPFAVTALMTIVTALIENLPLLVEAATTLVTSLVEGLGLALPRLIPAAVEAIMTIVQGLLQNLPLLLDAALELIKGLAEGIIAAIPVLLEALPEVIESMIHFLLDCIPMIVETGITLLTALVEALPDIITQIVDAIPKIIDGIIEAVIRSIPQIVEAGIQLLISLIQGLPQIITTIVRAVPQIVTAIADGFAGNIDKIILAGVELFVSLIENLPTIILEIVKAVPQIISGIVEAFASSMYRIVEVGGNIVRGLWDGITGLASWLWNKVSGWISGIWDGICDFFGISSPSKEMAWVGEMMVKGLSGSISKNGDQAILASEKMAKGINEAMQTLTTDFEPTITPRLTPNLSGVSEWESLSKSGAGFKLSLHIDTFNNYTREDIESLTKEVMETAGHFMERKGACFL